jgi:hypothetical protein
MSGIELIAKERQRQIDEEGWSPEHDDEHVNGELAQAAVAYAAAATNVMSMLRWCSVDGPKHAELLEENRRATLLESLAESQADPLESHYGRRPDEGYKTPLLQDWPWDERWWKPSNDPIRDLVKAGALIAAEIDRLQRSEATKKISSL